MSFIDARDVPADPTSAAALAASGLVYRVIDMDDAAQAVRFQRAVARGFLGAEPADQVSADTVKVFGARRNIGVHDEAASDGLPVASVNSWVARMTAPGGGEIPMWAISAVTVAATHRRRGIARALLEGELRAAASAGVPLAGLTVSEATIYGRYGFGHAVPVVRYAVDTRRAGWAGPAPEGRVEFVDRETLADELGAVHERARTARAGQIPGWRGRWEGMAGISAGAVDRDAVRGVRFLDAEGRTRGALAYTLSEKEGSFRFALRVRLLAAETSDALAALWRFALQHDLVDEVTADLRPVDDPLPLMVADQRGVTQTVHDHGWLRILDVPAALESRSYAAPLDVVLQVQDDLGFAAGSWRLRVGAEGRAQVDAAEGATPDATLSVAVLSSLFAGGVRATALQAAGLVSADAETALRLDRSFLALPAPSLDIWY